MKYAKDFQRFRMIKKGLVGFDSLNHEGKMNIGNKALLIIIAVFALFYVAGKVDEKNGVSQLNPYDPRVLEATRKASTQAVEKASADTDLTKEQVEDIAEKAWYKEFNRQKDLQR